MGHGGSRRLGQAEGGEGQAAHRFRGHAVHDLRRRGVERLTDGGPDVVGVGPELERPGHDGGGDPERDAVQRHQPLEALAVEVGHMGRRALGQSPPVVDHVRHRTTAVLGDGGLGHRQVVALEVAGVEAAQAKERAGVGLDGHEVGDQVPYRPRVGGDREVPGVVGHAVQDPRQGLDLVDVGLDGRGRAGVGQADVLTGGAGGHRGGHDAGQGVGRAGVAPHRGERRPPAGSGRWRRGQDGGPARPRPRCGRPRPGRPRPRRPTGRPARLGSGHAHGPPVMSGPPRRWGPAWR